MKIKFHTLHDFLEKWRDICNRENIEHLTIPRAMLFGWGMLLLLAQTIIVLAFSGVFVLIVGVPFLIWIILFRQYYLIWKRYYSPVWPIMIHMLAFFATIFINVRFFDV